MVLVSVPDLVCGFFGFGPGFGFIVVLVPVLDLVCVALVSVPDLVL